MSLKTLFRWHLWLGLISGACMFVIGLTGAIAVFAEEIDWLVIPPLRVSAPADATHTDLETVVKKVEAAYPGARMASLHLSTRPSFAHTIAIQARQNGRNQRLDVYVNPFTGAVQGDRMASGGYFSSVYQFLRQTHVRLLLGLWGRVFVGICGVSLVLSCITGLWIYRGWIRKLFQLRLGGGWGRRAPWAELHKFVGVWSLLFNIVIGLTGAVLGLENLVNQVESKWMRPAVEKKTLAANAAARRAPTTGSVTTLPLNELVAKARAAFPDLTPRTITLPARAGGPIGFSGEVPAMLVAQSHVRTTNSITLNSGTGEVLNRRDGRNNTGWVRAYWMIDPLHFGYFGGLPTKVIWFVLGLTPSLLALTGTWMWWRRRAQATRPATVPIATMPGSGSRWIPWVAGAVTLIIAYWLVARALHTWRFNERFAEFWLVKPISIALVAFPMTVLLAFVIARSRARPWLYGTGWALMGAWYLLLTGILMP